MIEIRKKENESSAGLLFRFSKRVRQSGVLIEARKRRFKTRVKNRRKLRLRAAHRAKKVEETKNLKKLGMFQ